MRAALSNNLTKELTIMSFYHTRLIFLFSVISRNFITFCQHFIANSLIQQLNNRGLV